MDYQEIIIKYKNGGLDISDLNEKLEMAKPLSGRNKYRALTTIGARIDTIRDITNSLVIPENTDRLEEFENSLNRQLSNCFQLLVKSIRDTKSWKFLGLVASENTQQKFQSLTTPEKFAMLFEMNKKYQIFLEYQKLADIRDTISDTQNILPENVQKIAFVYAMFHAFGKDEIKKDFFCFDPKFLKALIEFKRSKTLRLEEFIKTKNKSIQFDYEKYSKFFSNENFRDIAENLVLTSRVLKVSVSKVIEYFSEISESEIEIDYFKDEYELLEQLKEKNEKMTEIKEKFEKEKAEREEKERIEREKKEAEERRKKEEDEKEKNRLLEEERKRQEAEKAERERIIGQSEGNTGNMENKIEEQKTAITVKEQVNPLIFAWLEREDLTIARRIGNKTLTAFFDKIQQIQDETGIRVSLFLVTNAGKEVALKRMQEFQKKAEARGFPRLIEGCLGGYSSFKIDASGKITDMALMSDVNKEKIQKLLETSYVLQLDRSIIDPSENNYLRYIFSDKKDKSINKRYLNGLVVRLLQDPKVKKQPLKMMPFIENNVSGIDVVLESQLKGISQLSEYYKTKYEIAPKKTMYVNIENIEGFVAGLPKENVVQSEENQKEPTDD